MHPGGLEYLCGVLWRAPSSDDGGRARPRPSRSALPGILGPRPHAGEARLRRVNGLPHRRARPCARRPPLPLRVLREDGATPARVHARDGRGGGGRAPAPNRMVDLYRVVREGVRVGEPSYSIKSLERFYMPARTTRLPQAATASSSTTAIARPAKCSLLDAIRDYNRDDCLSTLLLRDWLIERAKEAGRWPRRGHMTEPAPEIRAGTERVPNAERESERRRPRSRPRYRDPQAPTPVRGSSWPISSAFIAARRSRLGGPSSTGRSAVRRSSQDDDECLGGCVADGEDWIGQEKRSLTFRYRYPEQETKLREGNRPSRRGGRRAPAPSSPSMRWRGSSRSSAADEGRTATRGVSSFPAGR